MKHPNQTVVQRAQRMYEQAKWVGQRAPFGDFVWFVRHYNARDQRKHQCKLYTDIDRVYKQQRKH